MLFASGWERYQKNNYQGFVVVNRFCSVVKFGLSFLLMGFLLVGCGVKAAPTIPYSPVPQAIDDLKVFSRNGAVILEWSVPKKDCENKKLSNLGGFLVWRQFLSPDQRECPDCPGTYKLIVDIDYQFPQKARMSKKRVTYSDTQTKKEGKYRYKITSYTTKGVESSSSNRDGIDWSFPPPPPSHVKTTSGDRSVTLNWTFTPADDGNKPDAFNIYRRYSDQDYGLHPINENPIQQNKFSDATVANGKSYYYVVRSLRIVRDKPIESESSSETTAIPEDRTPPASPSVTMAFQSAQGVTVVWEPNLESAIGGYYVYRRVESDITPERISSLQIEGCTFLDKTFSAGLTYYYSVTAIDRSPRQNESDISQEIRVETEKHQED